jgi:UDP-3-O-[3-hydroxymyristoyl] glucosamine N-acyltransferase
MDSIIFYGFGGLAKTILPLLKIKCVAGYFAADPSPSTVIPFLGDYDPFVYSNAFIIHALGNNERREVMWKRITHKPYTVIADTAFIDKTASIGDGCLLMPGTIIQGDVTTGQAVLVNTKATIDHDCSIGDFCNIGVGAIIGSRSVIGAKVHIDIGAIIPAGSVVPDGTLIKAGAVYNQ